MVHCHANIISNNFKVDYIYTSHVFMSDLSIHLCASGPVHRGTWELFVCVCSRKRRQLGTYVGFTPGKTGQLGIHFTPGICLNLFRVIKTMHWLTLARLLEPDSIITIIVTSCFKLRG